MAHSDVVPADAAQWRVPPFAAEIQDGEIYGRGAVDTLGLLAAGMAVLVELRQRGSPLSRDVILLSEADEEAGSTGMRWLVRNAWREIDAEFALNEGGACVRMESGELLFQIQIAEKIPARVVLRARGVAGHGSLPREDNPVFRIARAAVRLTEAEHPVRLSAVTRAYLAEYSALSFGAWLKPLLRLLEDPQASLRAAAQVRKANPELAAMLTTTVTPTMLAAGTSINVIPGVAEARFDVRRLPGESREEIFARFRRIVNDPTVEIVPEDGEEMPEAEPSPRNTELYRAMETVLRAADPRARVLPYMIRGATDGAFLRARGMPVYGVPVFETPDGQSLAHANDERISLHSLNKGARLLLEIVERVAVER
jgi:acetylornithine deacetylase/succinyl-diaminopimelate desuccinylase-like protein